MKKSSLKLEFTQLLLLAAMRKAKLYFCILSFLVLSTSIFAGVKQGRFLYLTVFPFLFPEILSLLFATLDHKRQQAKKAASAQKEEAQVFFPVLRKKTKFSAVSFYAHLSTFVLYFIILVVLCVNYSINLFEPLWFRYVPFALAFASLLGFLLALYQSYRRLNQFLLSSHM